jgi:hypothetical protein
VHKVLLLQTREAKHPPTPKYIVFKVEGQHPPATDFTAGALPWVPPLNKNNKSLLFPHLQQHVFETLSMECTFISLTHQMKRHSRIYWLEGVKVRLFKIQ